ncbi:hypothetical protein ACU686_25500 [Yinghuangia aomiensis]
MSGGRMWAVGRTFLSDGTARPVMVEFDGRSWKQTALPPMPSKVSELRAVAARSPRDVWARRRLPSTGTPGTRTD